MKRNTPALNTPFWKESIAANAELREQRRQRFHKQLYFIVMLPLAVAVLILFFVVVILS